MCLARSDGLAGNIYTLETHIMEKTIFEQMGGTYYQRDGYLLPCLTAPDGPRIGIWGQRHLQYLLPCF